MIFLCLQLTPHHGPVSHTEREDPAHETERDDPPAMDTERADDNLAKNTEREYRDYYTKELQDCAGNSINSTTEIGSSKHARKHKQLTSEQVSCFTKELQSNTGNSTTSALDLSKRLQKHKKLASQKNFH